MMFWIFLALMCAVAIVILAWPLMRASHKRSIAYKDSNLGLYQHKLGELDQDLAEGRLDQEAYRIAREELDRELLQDIPDDAAATRAGYVGNSSAQPALAMLIATFIPAVSVLMYMQLGMHAGTEAFEQQQQIAEKKQPTVAEMVTILENRLLTQGGDATAWTMLGRGYKHLQRFEESASAYATALKQEPQAGANLMLEAAEAMALARNQKFDPVARELVLKAVSLEPGNITALWFAGVAEFQAGEYWQSVDHLAQMVELAPDEQLLMGSAKHYLEQSRNVLAAQGEDVSPIDEVLQLVAQSEEKVKPASDTDVRRIMVSVDVTDEIRSAYGSSTTVFVYARAQQGPKMPLAIQKLSLGNLPATVGLDDSMAMVEGMNLSTFDQLEVFARISPSGQAITQTGDATGSKRLDVVEQINEISILIDSVVQ